MTTTNFPKPPIIIGGCGRSGTTLMLAILGSHPNIFAIPEETAVFCPTAYEKAPILDSPIETRKIEHLLGEYSIPASCKRWCEKTPKNVLFFPAILKSFGNGIRLLHMVRDGRDVITSVHPANSRRFHVSPERWIMEVSIGIQLMNDPRVLTIRYEDLVLDFEPTLRHICDFLAEPYTKELPTWYSTTNIQWQDSWIGGKVRPIFTTSIGRWRRTRYSSVVETFLSKPHARECLERLGYIPTPEEC